MSDSFVSLQKEQDRFWAKVNKNGPVSKLGTVCYLWEASQNGTGYPVFYFHKKLGYAHRYSWQLSNCSYIPKNLEVDHLCKNTLCVRPDHLEIVSHKINNFRQEKSIFVDNSLKTSCPNGHKYDKLNTRIYNNSRYCRICNKEKSINRKREQGVREIGTYRPSNCKLTYTDAEEIRRKYVPRLYSQNMLAKEYNVTQSTIKDILLNRRYRKPLENE